MSAQGKPEQCTNEDDALLKKYDDPRQRLPSITLHGQATFGCGMWMIGFFNLLPLCFSLFAEGETQQVTQWVILGTLLLWGLIWNSNRRYYFKALKQGRKSVATLVDKYIYEHHDNARKHKQYVLLYEFESFNKNGELENKQVTHHCLTSNEYEQELGSTLNYYALALSKGLSKLSNTWPETWYTHISDDNYQQYLKRSLFSCLRLILTCLVIIWFRAGFLAGDYFIGDIETAQFWRVIFSNEPMMFLSKVMKQIPAVYLSLSVGFVFLFFNGMRILSDQKLPIDRSQSCQAADFEKPSKQGKSSDTSQNLKSVLTSIDGVIAEYLKKPAKSRRSYTLSIVIGAFVQFFALAYFLDLLHIPGFLAFICIAAYLFLWTLYLMNRPYHCSQKNCSGIAMPVISDSVEDKAAWSAKLQFIGHRCNQCQEFTEARHARKVISDE